MVTESYDVFISPIYEPDTSESFRSQVTAITISLTLYVPPLSISFSLSPLYLSLPLLLYIPRRSSLSLRHHPPRPPSSSSSSATCLKPAAAAAELASDKGVAGGRLPGPLGNNTLMGIPRPGLFGQDAGAM